MKLSRVDLLSIVERYIASYSGYCGAPDTGDDTATAERRKREDRRWSGVGALPQAD